MTTAAKPFGDNSQSPSSPARHAFNIVKSDVNDLPVASRSIYIAPAGDGGVLKITTEGGETLTTPPLNAGYHFLCVTRVWQTGSNIADNLLMGLW